MLTHGSDRVRLAGGKVILQSAIAKGWTPRTPKTLTSVEHPGTAVMWDELCFEVIEATPLQSGGVRYVLAAWRDEHTIRTLESYDAVSEGLRIADHERARRQQRSGIAVRLSGVVLGHLPASVQMHLENELGVRAARMTLLSCVPPLVIFGFCVVAHAEATLRRELSPIPFLLWPILGLLVFETGIRFYVVMSQGRPIGSAIGTLVYAIYRALSGKRDALPRTSGGRGDSVAFIPPPDDVAVRDALMLKEPLLTLLTPAEQTRLAERFGYDYRRKAFGVAWIILVAALLGATSSYIKFANQGSFTSLLSMLIAIAVVIEQALRLNALQRGPAGSVFAAIVRPLARDLLR
jgi:hypothetical protein